MSTSPKRSASPAKPETVEATVDPDVLKLQHPDLSLSQSLFLLQKSLAKVSTTAARVPVDQTAVTQARQHLLDTIRTKHMAPYYQWLSTQLNWSLDSSLLNSLLAENEKTLKALQDRETDAQKLEGASDVQAIQLERAAYYAQIGDKENAVRAYKTLLELPQSVGAKLDLLFCLVRLGFFFQDEELKLAYLDRAKTLIEEGGDWDRRNRLKSYEAVHLTSLRSFKEAAPIYLETLATFTSNELMPYRDYVKYAVIVSLLALDRVDIRKKVLNSPEILEVLHEIPHLETYLTSLYHCKYDQFFGALAALEPTWHHDHLLAAHTTYLIREMRLKAYAQQLESYRSLTLASMARSFGVSVAFIDKELARFIAAGRLHAVIDSVAGIVLTNRPDAKNAQYQQVIKTGDVLLNRVQKLSRVIQV